jgi:hypothetical protein
MKKFIVASAIALSLALVTILGVGYFAVRGLSAAAGTAITWLEPLIESSLPAELAPAEIQERLDTALARVRDGHVDAQALRDTVLWLPGALLDGSLDAAEVEALAGKLDRIIAAPVQAES